MNPMDIKRIRLMLGWSQERLARELGVSFCTVNRWERDKTTPSPMALRVLKRLRDKADQSNRRTTLRLGLKVPIDIERLGAPEAGGDKGGEGPEIKALTEDISIGGLMFRSQDGSKKKGSIQVGERLKINLDMGAERPVETLSEVVWAMDKGATKRFGVRFDQITPGHRVDFMNTLLINNPL